jgi:hypothetical protein
MLRQPIRIIIINVVKVAPCYKRKRCITSRMYKTGLMFTLIIDLPTAAKFTIFRHNLILPSGTGHSTFPQQPPISCQMSESEFPPDARRLGANVTATLPRSAKLGHPIRPLFFSFCLRPSQHGQELSISGRPYRHHSRPIRPELHFLSPPCSVPKHHRAQHV